MPNAKPAGGASVERLLKILADTYQQTPNVSAIADELGIHRSQLARSFKKQTGVSITEYIRKLRINESMRLLRETEKSISVVAMECGFSDQSHFTRAFRAETSLTPSKFRGRN